MTPEPLAPKAALAALARALEERPAPEGRLREDDFGDAVFVVRIPTVTQLDADEMNDRLHAFVAREAARTLPGASAGVSFHHARPEDVDDEDFDVQAVWHDVDAVFRLDLHAHPITREDAEAWARLVPRFLATVHGSGRPEGWRDVDAGSSE